MSFIPFKVWETCSFERHGTVEYKKFVKYSENEWIKVDTRIIDIFY